MSALQHCGFWGRGETRRQIEASSNVSAFIPLGPDGRIGPAFWTVDRHYASFDLKANIRQSSGMPTIPPEP